MSTMTRSLARATVFTCLIALTPAAFASGVYKCVDENGATTFSFTSCPDIAPAVIQSAVAQPVGTKTRARLAELDSSIVEIREELDAVKADYEESLRSLSGVEYHGTDRLTDRFDRDTTALFAELTRLKAEKARLRSL